MLTLQVVHGVSWRGVLSYGAGIDWRQFAQGALACFLVTGLGSAILFQVDPRHFRMQHLPPDYVVWFVLALGVILVQSLSEEVFYKGYVLRVLGAVVPFRLPVGAIVIAVFTYPHLGNADMRSDLAFNLIYFVLAEVVSLALFFRTQNLGASAGIHWMRNVWVFVLLVTVPGTPTAMPVMVYTDPVLMAGGSYLLDPLAHAQVLLWLALLLTLLVHPRSPFCLVRREPSGNAAAA